MGIDVNQTALDGAHEAGILHRDISFNNIMLNENGEAIVNDWDHAGNVKREPGKPHRTFRTVRVSHSEFFLALQ